jgi:hypothetical protein
VKADSSSSRWSVQAVTRAKIALKFGCFFKTRSEWTKFRTLPTPVEVMWIQFLLHLCFKIISLKKQGCWHQTTDLL